MSNTIVHLLRHGEVDNPENVIYERLPDFHLSVRGQNMAKAAAEFIGEDPVLSQISAVYSSPLDRALETARPVAAALGKVIITDDRLIESAHEFAGKNLRAEVEEMARGFKIGRLVKLFINPFRPSWGEPYEEIALRMKAAITELAKKYEGQQILIVSHQSPIWQARRFFEKKTLKTLPNQRICALASLTTLIFNNEAGELSEVIYRTPAAGV